MINTRCAINRKSIEAAQQLKWIARLGSGLDIIDLDAAEERGILVISAPEGNAQAVAEHAMAMLLSLANQLIPADREIRQGEWLREKNRGWEISGKTIGIIGYGNNGSAFGKLWAGWDVNVIAYDKYLENYGDEKVKAVSLEELQKHSNIISLHVPLTAETKEMINDDFLAHCMDQVVIINTSRGKVIDLKSLVNALKDKKVKGACLDVLPYEPPSAGTEEYQTLVRELFSMENVILSPHVAGWTVESRRKISEVLLLKIKSQTLDRP